MQLEMLGWDGFFASQPCAGVPGRVASANRERFVVWTEAGEVNAVISGNLRRSGSAWPAAGDWVALRPDMPVIEQVLERRTVLERKQPGRAIGEQVLAANIDVLFIVTGLDGDYSERRIERHLVVARQSGARPVIVLNKADLAESYGIDLPEVVVRLRAWSRAPVLSVTALEEAARTVPDNNPGAPEPGSPRTNLGSRGGEPASPRSGLCSWGGEPALSLSRGLDFETWEAINHLLSAGETAALIGSSGVGKSTIVNRLLGQCRQATREVRKDDDRGRHTTTARSMFLMPGGWLLIDMPGLREVQLWTSPDQIDASFGDVSELAAGCRFRDCTHTAEPGCAVLAAGIDEGRLNNYHKMQRELDYLERKADKRRMSETRARWKVIHKAMRNHPKEPW